MKYSFITYPDVNNGLGCRVTLWVSGCPHHCEGCHNPETWNFNFGKEFTTDTKDTLFNILSNDYIKGLTISGGEPLCVENQKNVLEVINEVKNLFPNKDIWVYTGYTLEKLISLEDLDKDTLIYKILSNIDVLVDGKFKLNLRDVSLAFRGSSNQRVIDVKRSLDKRKVITLDV